MAQKVSVIIPNYNGRKILEKNLPEVIKNCPKCEIIVIDDASTDESVKYLKQEFKSVRVVTQEKNQGFSQTVNNGVRHAKSELVLLLNSDIVPRPGFLKILEKHFENEPNLFAVGISDDSHEEGKIVIKGRGGASFKMGFFTHYALPPIAAETLWVSGGSGLFSRTKFLELKGFDKAYAPFYWEDIDLSYRARKAGYYCIFEPESKVDHYHEEGAIKKTRSENYIKTISYKNQFIFVWKNIEDWLYCLEHLIYLPYHFAVALTKGDWPFFNGFFKASLQIPKLILNYHQDLPRIIKTDREILSEFKKS